MATQTQKAWKDTSRNDEDIPISSLELDNLMFDPENPRLPSSINSHDEKAVLEWMLDDATIIELMRSIGENGYFQEEPLLIIESQKNPGKYIVVEGNRRLAATKLLADPSSAPIKKQAVLDAHNDAKTIPAELPARVYARRTEILAYLGYRHITGIKPWDPLAKARYLDQLRSRVKERSSEKQFKTLAKIIGSNPSYVARLLTGLSLFKEIEANDFYSIKGVKNEDDIDFSLITTALTYSNIVQFLGLRSNTDPTLKDLVKRHLKELTTWIFERGQEGRSRIGESRNLKKLNAVVGSDDAVIAFKKGASLDEATLLTGLPSEVFRSSIAKAKSHMQYARNYVHKVSDLVDTDVDNLLEIGQLASFLADAINARVSKNDHRRSSEPKK